MVVRPVTGLFKEARRKAVSVGPVVGKFRVDKVVDLNIDFSRVRINLNMGSTHVPLEIKYLNIEDSQNKLKFTYGVLKSGWATEDVVPHAVEKG